MSDWIARRIGAARAGGLCFVLLLLVAGVRDGRAQMNAPGEAVKQGAQHYGVFAAGGLGTGERSDFTFINAGGQIGFVLTPEHMPGILKGNFEVGSEVVPFWQSYAPHLIYTYKNSHGTQTYPGGGTYHGVALTPLILRWNFTSLHSHFVPWAQGAGGLLYTTHKYPLPGTSVWNFEPQFGIGAHYFLSDRHSIDLSANAIHISNASLGDHNPGVNALVQFQLGYTWWEK